MPEHATADVFAAAVPEDVDPNDNAQFTDLLRRLDLMAKLYIYRQWDGVERKPASIKHLVSDWMVTDKAEDVEQFQPAHDCTTCRAGNDQAVAFLRDNPGRWVAMANLHYIEVWE